ncbi:MAG: AAA family ATPase [Gammaproteobacteria bacterium]|nr:AAA family ATPase [Gammaproteobacteria bacterium]
MIKRTAETTLRNWYHQPLRKPLVLRGARQVGKSTLIREFSKTLGICLHEVNLERELELELAFKTNNPALILRELENRLLA